MKVKSSGSSHFAVFAHAMEKVVAVESEAMTEPTILCWSKPARKIWVVGESASTVAAQSAIVVKIVFLCIFDRC